MKFNKIMMLSLALIAAPMVAMMVDLYEIEKAMNNEDINTLERLLPMLSQYDKDRLLRQEASTWRGMQNPNHPEGSDIFVKLLLDAGANPNTKNDEGVTPLMNAAASGGSNRVYLLLDRGAQKDLVSSYGATAAQMARNRELAQKIERYAPKISSKKKCNKFKRS